MACHIPETPSHSINSKLQTHFSTTSNNAFRNTFGQAVCGFFNATTTVYKTLTQDHAHRNADHMWMASCGIVSVMVALSAWIAYSIIMSLTFVFYGVLYYGASLIAILGIVLGMAAIILYKRDNAAAAASTPRTPSEETQSGFRSSSRRGEEKYE